jgi:hypothetical protein
MPRAYFDRMIGFQSSDIAMRGCLENWATIRRLSKCRLAQGFRFGWASTELLLFVFGMSF